MATGTQRNNKYYGGFWAGNSKRILNFGSREVRSPLLNKRGSCRTLGILEKNDVRPSVSRSVVLTINQAAIARDSTIDRCRRLSVFFTANICTNPDVHTWHILVILYSYCACQLSSMESTQSVPESGSLAALSLHMMVMLCLIWYEKKATERLSQEAEKCL